MSVFVELKAAQLLCSRLCHDLVGPASAVNAGVELMAEPGAGSHDDALALIGASAAQLNRRLAFFRAAFGLGAFAGGTVAVAETGALAAGLLADGRVALDWPPADDPGTAAEIPGAAARLILNMVLLGAGSLPRGGDLAVRVAGLAEGTGVAMTAAGPGAGLREDVRAAMAAGAAVGDLSAYNIHAYLAARLAEELAVELEISEDADDEVRLATLVPTGTPTP